MSTSDPSGPKRPPLPPGPYLVVGLARSGVAAAKALVALGARVYGTDSGNPPGAGRLAELGVELELDGDGIQLLDEVKTVVKSPGVPAEAPVVAAARERGLDVIGELELGWRLLDNRFAAVTGTNGKTTVAEWLGHTLREAGMEATVAGNVGTPLASLPGEIDPSATIVCECSSFQLEDSLAFAPEVAVLLNVTPDHLDRHGTLAAYAEAKLRIFSNQTPEDTAIVDADDPVVGEVELPGEAIREPFGIDACADEQRCAVSFADGEIRDSGGVLVRADELPLAGEHNLRNAMAVAAAALASGADREGVARGLRSFAGVPHRLERVRELDGVVYVNDSKATNVAAAAAALAAFGSGVHAILGGSLKGGDFADLTPAVRAHCTACYLVGEAAPRLRADLADAGVPLHDSGDLATALADAAAAAVPGETVLLAPACASFDAFRDYEERGERFRELVAALEGGT
ncbi:MAG: UDP-N-acetylmuramoyl-L-alanine--D-glutamate ligase [Solirubrobacterales bacterium]|nr:UDP-N-acetylmuramoyl-L-alanine--D-glutamate ligase [Solirubrobacterales bacterium]MCB8970466.1 UDP-N-acetylmuramoyl-L-alanine--D-glutamate ligase [Thermoleophilales bacterium]